MQYTPDRMPRFKKDYKKLLSNANFKEDIFICVLKILLQGKKLESKYKDHKLKGVFKSCRECHLQNDILLIYNVNKKTGTISLLRIGSHSELF